MPITLFDLDQTTAGVDAQATYPEQQPNFTPLQQVLLETQGGGASRIDQVTFQIEGATASESLSLNAAALAVFAGIWTYDPATGLLTITANDLSDAAWNTILENVVYYNSSDAPDGTRTITVTVTDLDDYESYYDSLGYIPPIVEPSPYDLVGTDGGDFGQGGAGDQSLDGRGGNDTGYGDGQSPSASDGNDVLNGGDGNDQLNGGGADDQMLGGVGNDHIFGDYQSPSDYDGDDLIDAGDGNDTVAGGGGSDSIAGGTGGDRITGDLDYETDGGADVINGGGDDDQIEGSAGDDEIVGGDGNDTLYGDYRFATGSDGNDVIAGGLGDDVIYGGGGPGSDVAVYAGARSEYLVVQNADGSFTVTGIDTMRDGTDTVREIEMFRFSDGDIPADEVVDSTGGGGHGSQQASATLTIDIPFVNDAPDDIDFSAGPLPEDTTVGTRVGIAVGSDPDDEPVTYSLTDDAGGLFWINARTGGVRLVGALDYETATSHTIEIEIADAAGATYRESFTIEVTDAIDDVTQTLTPLPDRYDVSDSPDNYTLNALSGDDVVTTGSGTDTINGGRGEDRLLAGDGNDTLYGRQGDDTLSGEAGDDLLYGNDENDLLAGGVGDDTLEGGNGDDTLLGGDGNDMLIGNHGTDVLRGGRGDDVYHIDAAGEAIEAADAGIDNVRAAVDYVLGANIEEMALVGGARAGTGNELANKLFGSGGADTLAGLAGDDIVRGGTGRDVLRGGDGADLLDGGEGEDTLTGGAGRDLFQFRDGDMNATPPVADLITDFSQADHERIQLNLVDADITATGNQAFTFIGTDAYSGQAGELRYSFAQGDTWVEADVDGDGVADWFIGVAGTIDLTAADFVL